MPRQPRFDAPGRVHHVMMRGIERRAIFHDDDDRAELRGRLCEVVPEAGAAAFAWVFLPNHVHLVIVSGETPLSQVMSRLNTSYALRFNRRHERVGYLFQNRFKSRLVAGDADLQGLLRYVHLNPLRAGLVPSLRALEAWPWSGHGGLMGARAPWAFEDTAAALALFDRDAGAARARLRGWMEEGLRDERALEASAPAAAGAPRPRPAPRGSARGPGSAAATDGLAALVETACRHFGTTPARVLRGDRDAHTSRARAAICHLAVRRWRLSCTTVARALRVSVPAVSQAAQRGAAWSAELEARGLPASDVS